VVAAADKEAGLRWSAFFLLTFSQPTFHNAAPGLCRQQVEVTALAIAWSFFHIVWLYRCFLFKLTHSVV
jgi:hypothetical protein